LLYEFSEAFYVKAKPFTSIDAIVVLAGGEGRIQEAIDLYEQHKPSYLIISGVGKKFNIKKKMKRPLSILTYILIYFIIANRTVVFSCASIAGLISKQHLDVSTAP